MTNLEKLTIDRIAELIYQSCEFDEACTSYYPEGQDGTHVEDRMTCDYGNDCIGCIKRWLEQESVD